MPNNLLLEENVTVSYTKKFGKWYPDAAYRAKLACQMIGSNKKFKHILDGAGFFPSAFIFSQAYVDATVTILSLYENDVLPEFNNSINYQHGDVTDIKYPDEYFDMIYLGETIEHLYDIKKCFEEAKRILKPGGYLAITTPNLASWFNRLFLLFGKCPINYHPAPMPYNKSEIESLKALNGKDHPLHHYHIRLFTLSRLIDYLKFSGFKIIRYDIVNFITIDRRFRHIRRLLSYIIPKNAKEGIILIAQK